MKSWHLPFLFLQSQSSQCNFEKSDIWVPRPRRIMIIPSGERSCSAYRRAVGASGGSVLGTLCHNCPQLANLFCSNISKTEATFHAVGMGESNFVLTKADKDGRLYEGWGDKIGRLCFRENCKLWRIESFFQSNIIQYKCLQLQTPTWQTNTLTTIWTPNFNNKQKQTKVKTLHSYLVV